jgi:hypothetical protein
MDSRIDELNKRLDTIESNIIQMGLLYDSHYYGNLCLDEIESIRKHLEASHEVAKALPNGDASAKDD